MAGQRNIFEEVSETRKPAATPGGVSGDRGRGRGRVRGFVVILFVMVVVQIAIGGLTRLTDSGLSITQWAPITGAIPPLTEAAWQAELEAYRTTTEYQEQNRGMSLGEFKSIYWWEWGHRQWARIIGLVWAIGFVGLLAAKSVPVGWTGRLVFLGFLGGLQGVAGWWMVHSGLAPGMFDVASYRLAVHLGLAFWILALMAWYILRLGRGEAELIAARREGDRRLVALATGLIYLSILQILIGALVAGIDAGRNYIDWPLMAGAFTPPDMWVIEPWYRNLFENDGTVQFFHRITGYVLFASGITVWMVARRSARAATKRAFDWVVLMLLGQITLGIVTVMYSSPWHLAIFHQFGAVILITLVVRARFVSRYPLPQSVRGST
ncbi:MAG: COX15/CtaA family protein [Roseicyclus sp.]|nr:COX15/CtaA family protein [Roseicyclus sp.]